MTWDMLYFYFYKF